MLNIKAKEAAPRPVELYPETDVFNKEALGGMVEKPTPAPPEPNKKKATTMKIIVWVCLLNGLAWVWCSYILAWMDREQIAESLSQVALTEIIGVVLVYAIKSVIENLSKNNSWPDKCGLDLTATMQLEKMVTTMKAIVLVCLLNGFAWVWCSYILAWQGKVQIAESLSKVAITEIIAVVLVYAAKSLVENLSKNNSWPDKPDTGQDSSDGVG